MISFVSFYEWFIWNKTGLWRQCKHLSRNWCLTISNSFLVTISGLTSWVTISLLSPLHLDIVSDHFLDVPPTPGHDVLRFSLIFHPHHDIKSDHLLAFSSTSWYCVCQFPWYPIYTWCLYIFPILFAYHGQTFLWTLIPKRIWAIRILKQLNM